MSKKEYTKVEQTCIEMMKQRGYHITKDHEDYFIASRGKKKKCIFKNIVDKLNVSELKNFLNLTNHLSLQQCLIICSEGITPGAKKLVKLSTDIKIEVFQERELEYNLTRHRLVPKHKALSKSEAKIFKEKYGVKCPLILKSDAVCRFYNFARGDIIEVTRSDGYVSYRLVK